MPILHICLFADKKLKWLLFSQWSLADYCVKSMVHRRFGQACLPQGHENYKRSFCEMASSSFREMQKFKNLQDTLRLLDLYDASKGTDHADVARAMYHMYVALMLRLNGGDLAESQQKQFNRAKKILFGIEQPPSVLLN
jgi:hypothetical protein